MMHAITVELSEATYQAVQQAASRAGTTPEKAVVRAVETAFQSQRFPTGLKLSDLFGSVSVGHPKGVDNDALDADLAREY